MTGPRELPTEVLATAEMSKKTHRSIFKPTQPKEATRRFLKQGSGQLLQQVVKPCVL